jgi:hypothetical protein
VLSGWWIVRHFVTLTALGFLVFALAVAFARPLSAAPHPDVARDRDDYCVESWFYESGEPLPHLTCWTLVR